MQSNLRVARADLTIVRSCWGPPQRRNESAHGTDRARPHHGARGLADPRCCLLWHVQRSFVRSLQCASAGSLSGRREPAALPVRARPARWWPAGGPGCGRTDGVVVCVQSLCDVGAFLSLSVPPTVGARVASRHCRSLPVQRLELQISNSIAGERRTQTTRPYEPTTSTIDVPTTNVNWKSS
jgi:hypothetical protein